MGDDLKDKAAAALRSSGARARVLSYHAQEKLGTLAHYAEVSGRRTVVVADRYGRRAAQTAVVIGRRLNEEYGPAVKGYGHRLTVKYGIDEKFTLRPLDDSQSFSEAMGPEFEMLLAQVQEIPTAAVPFVFIVALRALKGGNVVISEVVRRWLSSGTKFSRLSFLAATAPGWLALFLYRRALLESRPPLPPIAEKEPSLGGWALQLGQDVRRLPPFFWISTAVSTTATLQALKEVSTAAISRAFLVRKRTVFAAALVYLLAQHHGERARAIVSTIRGRMSPERVEALENKVKLFHALVSALARKLVPGSGHHQLSGGGARFASRGSVDQETIDRLLLSEDAAGSSADEERN